MNPARGIALKILSTFVFTLMLVCIKAVGDRVPEGEVVFFRSAFAVFPIVGLLAWQGGIAAALRTRRPLLHLRRGVFGVVSMGLWFAALQRLPLPEAMAINYAAPLLIVALGALLLGERVRLYRWSAVAVGFLGILIILWPRLTLLRGGLIADAAVLGAGLALLSAVFQGFTAIFVRSMTQTEATGAIVLYFSITAALMSLLTLPFGWVAPAPEDAALLVLAGLLGGTAQIIMTNAYRHADASTLAPLEYVSMIWGVAFGYLVFAEAPGIGVLVGGAVVVGAGVFIILRERHLGLARARQRNGGTL